MKRVHRFFIPSHGNKHKPYALRTPMLIFATICILVLELILFTYITVLYKPATSNISRMLSSIIADQIDLIAPSILINNTNSFRTDNTLLQLAENSVLDEAAQLKANDMAKRSYFAHRDPDGNSAWYWMDKVGYNYSYAGENLAVDFFDAPSIVNAWINSPTHRANLLNTHFKEIGIGLAHGNFNNHETTYVVQLFGSSTPPTATSTPIVAISKMLGAVAITSIAGLLASPAQAGSEVAIILVIMAFLLVVIPVIGIIRHHKAPNWFIKARKIIRGHGKQLFSAAVFLAIIGFGMYFNYGLVQSIEVSPNISTGITTNR